MCVCVESRLNWRNRSNKDIITSDTKVKSSWMNLPFFGGIERFERKAETEVRGI